MKTFAYIISIITFLVFSSCNMKNIDNYEFLIYNTKLLSITGDSYSIKDLEYNEIPPIERISIHYKQYQKFYPTGYCHIKYLYLKWQDKTSTKLEGIQHIHDKGTYNIYGGPWCATYNGNQIIGVNGYEATELQAFSDEMYNQIKEECFQKYRIIEPYFIWYEGKWYIYSIKQKDTFLNAIQEMYNDVN